MSEKPPSIAELNAAQQYAVSQRYARSNPSRGRIAAFEELHLELIKAAALYESDSLQNKRDAIAVSLLAVDMFLRQRGIAPIASRPIMRVLTALTERENNILDPLFCERPRASRPRSSLAKNQSDGAIAAMANHWLAHNRDRTRPQREQFSEIARKLGGCGLGEVTAARIKQARELVSAESADHPARTTYELVRQWLSEASDRFGTKDAFGVLLPIVSQASPFMEN